MSARQAFIIAALMWFFAVLAFLFVATLAGLFT